MVTIHVCPGATTMPVELTAQRPSGPTTQPSFTATVEPAGAVSPTPQRSELATWRIRYRIRRRAADVIPARPSHRFARIRLPVTGFTLLQPHADGSRANGAQPVTAIRPR